MGTSDLISRLFPQSTPITTMDEIGRGSNFIRFNGVDDKGNVDFEVVSGVSEFTRTKNDLIVLKGLYESSNGGKPIRIELSSRVLGGRVYVITASDVTEGRVYSINNR
ncbi:hypothetical protein HYX02_00585 [Candidatus Woesearchaeota archaeon]|nr:hypothetical protein [Candidatus Woesearchaeota archaeon]